MKRLASLWIVIFLTAIECPAVERPDTLQPARGCGFSLCSTLFGASSSIAINASLTELLKDNIRAKRPDGNGDHSFPSRHASYAFTVASILSHELYGFSPLWVSTSHTLANVVAMQRVYSSRHYPGDVLAGAALGIASTELGYCISRWIFPNDRCRNLLAPAYNARSLTTSTLSLITFPSHSHGLAVGSGIESAAALSFPLSEYLGAGATFSVRSHPVYLDGSYIGGLNGAALTADAYACHSLGFWQVDGRLSVGMIHNFDRPSKAASWAPLFNFSAAFTRRVARGIMVGPCLGLDITDRPSALCAMTAGLVIKAEF